MNIISFLTKSDDELIDWADQKARQHASGLINMSNDVDINEEELILILAVESHLKEKGITLKNMNWKNFVFEVDAELGRRNAI